MNNFIVSARKYRPTTFDTVVGQESITTTLKSAIKTNHLAQSYLFCGPRGVGKTTCARILAKTINCQNLSENTEACDECESCRSFNSSRSFNIHELDAASNNKVDDIRLLTDLVRIPPQVGRYSIYIIDEVHMLSTSAFNAFLKTLEEPPAHAIFILATTEKQKIIPTILSRCQIFDFNRITIDDIVKRLTFVAENEKIEAETEALHIIAQKADGAMRDALSIFDQIVSFSGRKITYAGVIENLNVLDYEYYLSVTEAFMKEDIPAALIIFNEILEKGFDGHNFIAGLSTHFRNLLVCKHEKTSRLLEVGASIRDRYLEQTSRLPVNTIYRALDILGNCDIQYRSSRNPRLHVEITLVRLTGLFTSKGISDDGKPEDTAKSEGTSGGAATEKKSAIPDNPAPGPKAVDSSPAEGKKIMKATTGTVSQVAPKTTDSRPLEYGSSSKSFSIKEQMKSSGPAARDETDSVMEEPPEPIVNETPFDQEMLIKSWKSFGENSPSGSKRMSGIIKGIEPRLKDGFSIELQLSNDAQKEYFDTNYKGEIINYLRSELKNDLITFETVVTEQSDNHTPYSEEEKYQHLLKKNPALDSLKNNIRLEFD